MKKIFLLLLASGFSLAAVCQTVQITTDKNNFLFIGVTNALTIAVDNKSPEDIIVESADAQIDGGQGNKYICRVYKAGEVIIKVLDKKTRSVLGSKSYTARVIPNPLLVLGGATNGMISREALKEIKKIEVKLADIDTDIAYSIDSCSLTLVKLKNGNTRDFFVTSAPFSEELEDEFKRLREGDLILLRNVYVKGPEGLRLVPPAVFTVSTNN